MALYLKQDIPSCPRSFTNLFRTENRIPVPEPHVLSLIIPRRKIYPRFGGSLFGFVFPVLPPGPGQGRSPWNSGALSLQPATIFTRFATSATPYHWFRTTHHLLVSSLPLFLAGESHALYLVETVPALHSLVDLSITKWPQNDLSLGVQS